MCIAAAEQAPQDGHNRLKRVILIGDHHQLPPVVKNHAFQKYSHLDQPLFTRFVRLGVPYVELSAQGRARPSIAKLYNWRYRNLGDLPHVCNEPHFKEPNAGFALDFQFVDVAPLRCDLMSSIFFIVVLNLPSLLYTAVVQSM
jgi:intron-binding protein aquarius